MQTDLTDPQLYFNRELSWLAFNTRVLAQAENPELPPLERLKFLAIYGTNLDEFTMIRIAGLKSLYTAGIQETGADKMTPAEQLEAIHGKLHAEMEELERTYHDILTVLRDHHVHILAYDHLDYDKQEVLNTSFFEHIYPVIIPIAVDTTHPFPHLNNLSFGIVVKLADEQGNIKHGLVRIPRILSRFLKVEDTFVPVKAQWGFVVEYTATWCGPCGSWGAPLFHELIDLDRVVGVTAHASSDPMYNAALFTSFESVRRSTGHRKTCRAARGLFTT